MKNGATYFKWSVVLVGIIFLFLLFRRCGNTGNGKSTQDTVKVTVTKTIEVLKRDTQYVPRPYKVNVPTPYRVTDTLIEFELQRVDSAAILKDYLTKRYYRDTLKNKYGYFVLEDTVYKNIISGRGMQENLSIPTITKTYTIEARQRAMIMIGGEVLGNQSNILYVTGVNLGLKARNNKYYAVKGFLDKHGTAYYGFQFAVPIKLRK